MFGWNYRMIKTHEEDEEIGMLVEVQYDNSNQPIGFIVADLLTIKDFEMAYKDVQSQEGRLMTYFFDNGTFTETQDGLAWLKL